MKAVSRMYFDIEMAVSHFGIPGMSFGLSAFQILGDKWSGFSLTIILRGTCGKVAQMFLSFSTALGIFVCGRRRRTAQVVIAAADHNASAGTPLPSFGRPIDCWPCWTD